MDEGMYKHLLSRQAGGVQTTGESLWWGFGSFDLHWRRLVEGEHGFTEEQHAVLEELFPATLGNHTNRSVDRRLEPRRLDSWPPINAYSPTQRHQWFSWDDVCIVNGDNVPMARQRCNAWREIETEISHCVCTQEHQRGKACHTWTCEERDVGLFSVLFRTRQDIHERVHGVEKEEYTCNEYNEDDQCIAWTGDIRSLEEVEWSTCECIGTSCQSTDAQWRCDEYELPVTRDIFFEEYRGSLGLFFLIEFCCLCAVCRGGQADDGDGDAVRAAVCLGSCVGLILLPFIVVTFGLYGFLLVSLPWWTCRIAGCCWVLMKGTNLSSSEKPSLVRGASRLIGKQSYVNFSSDGNRQ